jgi:hypothetical protein
VGLLQPHSQQQLLLLLGLSLLACHWTGLPQHTSHCTHLKLLLHLCLLRQSLPVRLVCLFEQQARHLEVLQQQLQLMHLLPTCGLPRQLLLQPLLLLVLPQGMQS